MTGRLWDGFGEAGTDGDVNAGKELTGLGWFFVGGKIVPGKDPYSPDATRGFSRSRISLIASE
jgi:hypothetical protein